MIRIKRVAKNHHYANIDHATMVYQQNLSTGRTKGRGYFLDTDIRQAWYGHTLAQAIAVSNAMSTTMSRTAYRLDLW